MRKKAHIIYVNSITWQNTQGYKYDDIQVFKIIMS